MLSRTIVCLVPCLGLAGYALADTDGEKSPNRNALLKGRYRVITHIACTSSDQGFASPPSLQALGFGESVIDHDVGTIFFDGQGNASETRRGISVFPQAVTPGAFPSGTYEVTCRYTYSVRLDKSFTLEGSCTGALPAGPAAGLSVEISPAGGTGQISESGAAFIVGGVEPVQQTLKLSNGFQTKRLCGASTTGIRLHRRGR
jgi:hypothetical protein